MAAQTAPLEKRLAETSRGIDRIVSAIERGAATQAMEARMLELDRERQGIEAALAQIETEREKAPVDLLPSSAESYAELIADLKATLADLDPENSQAHRRLAESVRDVIDRIVIRPLTQARGGPIDVEIFGTLARFMGAEEHAENVLCGALVAGGGIEPPTCGL